MSGAKRQAPEFSVPWTREAVRRSRKDVWSGVLEWLAAHRRRRVAVILYAELSKLSDAELERRGIAGGDLHRHISGMLFRR
jgi:hypothetical protein